MAASVVELLWGWPGACLRMPEELRPLLSARLPYASIAPSAKVVARQKYEVLGAVGDTVTRSLLDEGVEPLILIYDCHEKRAPTSCPRVPGFYDTIEVSNPRSNICFEAVCAICRALSAWRPTAIRVHGEEDLLLLPLVMLAPQETTVVYGQPGEGMALMPVTSASKRLVKAVLECFTPCTVRQGF